MGSSKYSRVVTTFIYSIEIACRRSSRYALLLLSVCNVSVTSKGQVFLNETKTIIFQCAMSMIQSFFSLFSLATYFARKQNEKKQNEKEFFNELKLKQEHQVEKYRSYRIGELPDIQIRVSDIIIPLQALAQYDDHTARLLYASLFTSILNALEEKLSTDEYAEIIRTIQYRFDVMLSQSELFYPSFVAALLDIVLAKPDQLTISAQYISASTIASHLESVGILTLECFLACEQTKDRWIRCQESTKKKLKTDPDMNYARYRQIDQWLELAKCYRSLANYDDVRGIFSQTPGLKPITLRAIEEESHADFLLALNSYITALEQYHLTDETNNDTSDQILELEQEFWTQSMLNCCNQLNNWTLMAKHIFIENTTFDSLWSNAHQLNYLMPYAIRAKLKLLITGTEQEQTEQNDLCQFFNNLSTTTSTVPTTLTGNAQTTFVKRSYIEKQYPFELATFFLYQKDFDRK
jgi:DNA-dependent protein kinase catalytic subunit